ncbi:hypothetical protein vseg_016373 [Gypsophila vaccaria]
MASAPGEAPLIDSPPPPDILPSDPPPPDVEPPTVSPPPPDPVPPIVSPPPPDPLPPTVSPPPPDPIPPTVSPPLPDPVPPPVSPPPPPDVVPPPVSPPPPPDIVPPPVSPPPPPDVVPPPPDAIPPTESPPPPPPDALPPLESPPPPPPDALPPTESPPPSPTPDVATPPSTVNSPPPPPPKVNSPPPPRSLSPPVVNSPPEIPSPSHVPPPPKSSSSTPIAVGAALGSVVLLLAVFGLIWFLCVKKRRRRNPHELESHYKPGDGYNGASGYPPSAQQYPTSSVPPSQLAAQPSMSTSADFSSGQPHQSSTNGNAWSHSSGAENPYLSSGQGMVLGSGTIAFTYDDLKIATNGFSSVNLLGQGGFGYVHKGMLQNGKIVAVKSLKSDSGQGEREFQAEVETISRVHHKHLVTLVGYCITDSQKLLVYEYVENKTMEFHLHGKGQPVMDWPTRLKIAIGAAKGLAYLHEDCHPKIIHRDIKAANILLDHSFEAQVADFGLAKFSSDANTHISTRVMGTFGYLAPEYASSGQLSDKSDVFSFGVLLLELVTGRRPVDFTSRAQMEDSLVDWARPLLAKTIQDGNFDALVDPRLEKDYNPMEMGSMITCAASCVRHSAKRRPRMSQVVRALEGHIELSDLNDGVKPGFSSLYSSADLYEAPNTEDMSRFRRTAYGEDEESSEYSATRNEFTGGR